VETSSPRLVEKKKEDRRKKKRFVLRRELRYKLLADGVVTRVGAGQTQNIGSGGVSFACDGELPPGGFIELSISWPVLLENQCPMRLIAFGRVLRAQDGRAACTIDKYEFRTQSRTFQMPVRTDSMLQRWADYCVRENMKVRIAGA
jgi:hypothetical protein